MPVISDETLGAILTMVNGLPENADVDGLRRRLLGDGCISEDGEYPGRDCMYKQGKSSWRTVPVDWIETFLQYVAICNDPDNNNDLANLASWLVDLGIAKTDVSYRAC